MKTHQKNLCKKFLVAVMALTFMEAFQAHAQDVTIMDDHENTVYGKYAKIGNVPGAASNTAFGFRTQQSMDQGKRNNSFGGYASQGLVYGNDNSNFR